MIHIALIDPELADAVTADTSRDLAVVWSGPDVEALIAATIDPLPDVIVLNRARLPADPGPTLQRLRRRIPARTVITTYTFAQSRDVEALRQGGSDVVLQGPLSVRTLRTFLLSLLIERRMKTGRAGPSRAVVRDRARAAHHGGRARQGDEARGPRRRRHHGPSCPERRVLTRSCSCSVTDDAATAARRGARAPRSLPWAGPSKRAWRCKRTRAPRWGLARGARRSRTRRCRW